ncbi:MAG: hypothetical protein AAGA78_05445, partial [Pseudomonadota bacterium]
MFEAIIEFVQAEKTPLGVLGFVFLSAATLTTLHLNRGEGDTPLRRFLAEGGLERLYTARLTATLDRLDRRLCPAEHLDETSSSYAHPRSPRRAWNELAYDRMLLLAVAYPIFSPLFIWLVTGWVARVGKLELVPQNPDWTERALLAALLGLLALGLSLRERLVAFTQTKIADPIFLLARERPATPSIGHFLVQAGLILLVTIVSVASIDALSFMGALAVVGAGLATFAGSGVVSVSVLVAVTVSIAILIAGTGSGVASVSVSIAVIVAIAGATALVNVLALAIRKAWNPLLVWSGFTAILFALIAPG